VGQPHRHVQEETVAGGIAGRRLAAAEPEQFQEKWEPVFRPELRENKYLERITDSVKC
jgi:hypothetical protein